LKKSKKKWLFLRFHLCFLLCLLLEFENEAHPGGGGLLAVFFFIQNSKKQTGKTMVASGCRQK